MKKAVPGHDFSTARQRKLSVMPPAETQPPARTIAQEAAQDLAVKAFIFLSVDAERARRFAAETGLGHDNLRASKRRDLLNGVLDYLAGNESLLLAFASNCGIDPADIARASAILSGASRDSNEE